MALTPMMQQYFEIKENYKDCILFFRLGDFYEMFFEDAETASRELELVLTGRDCGLEERAPMCGIPYHAANGYLGRLISKGYKVAICEQVEDPALAKGIVKRDVIKVVTPGTYNEGSSLEEDKNNFIMSIFTDDIKDMASVSYVDISTGELYTTEFSFTEEKIIDEIYKVMPSEIILGENIPSRIYDGILNLSNIYVNKKNIEYFTDNASSMVKEQLNTSEFENKIMMYSINAILKYILDTQKTSLSNINNAQTYNIEQYMSIDINSRRNLEITETIRDKSKKGSLLWVLDKTATSMGSRTMRKWVEQPLLNKRSIQERLDAVEELKGNLEASEELKEILKEVYDIERISGKIAAKNVNARELISLRNSIANIPDIKKVLKGLSSTLLKNIDNSLEDLSHISSLIESSIKEDPAVTLKDGNLIKTGFDKEIDDLREAKLNGKKWIANLEASEREATGIKSLKVGFNKVFGYYIEITRANYSSIPEGRYIRKQTLANAERFITQDLKEMEDKILGAEEKLIQLEYETFVKIRDSIESEIFKLKKSSKLIADIDCILSLAIVARENNYEKPLINEDNNIEIVEGRHPVVEKVIPRGTFVSNNCTLNSKDHQMLIVTGPNMAGKSTYMRQVALISIMAQVGSFIPAKKANLCINDKIFTRIGASDDLAGGKSTFMVEMSEVSNILKFATKNSLVILDEVGRGTSTYDGLSIAWSVIEYICTNKSLKCKTLFATHYHELTELEEKIEGIKNFSVAVKEVNNNIVFLRKIIRGGADQSYGIEVAKLAGLPEDVISRAKEILKSLEKTKKDKIEVEGEAAPDHNSAEEGKKASSKGVQLGIIDIEKDNLINYLSNLDIINLTPMEAMNILYKVSKDSKALL
ncbi:DNA mismatch repair protein MutS [Clostridium polynesiense]|uniref:DNA mismatch repair protein MutS n=1 Tax=Clostridium polynesiense TaxID=1325933 RepID=UPI00058E2067|nr:DNA mismatch repair protein MutS [Clostridium polynesiense]